MRSKDPKGPKREKVGIIMVGGGGSGVCGGGKTEDRN